MQAAESHTHQIAPSRLAWADMVFAISKPIQAWARPLSPILEHRWTRRTVKVIVDGLLAAFA